MRTVSLNLTTEGVVTPDNVLIGYAGEHNITSLEVSLPSELATSMSFFRLILGDYLSDDLYPTDNKIIYPLPQSVMLSNTLLIQLEGYVKNDVGEIEVVFKSDVVTAIIKPSICACHEVPKELEEDLNGAYAKLSYYVQNSTELSNNISAALEEAKDFVTTTSEDIQAKADTAKQTLSDMVREGYSVLNQTKETLSSKADRTTTLAGYGITDAYTKSETDLKLLKKADSGNIYTKAEIDNALSSGMVVEYQNTENVFEEYLTYNDITLEKTHYLYIEYPAAMRNDAKYKIRWDAYFDYTEIRNLCVCVGDIHHPVLQEIDMTYDMENYTFMESAEFTLPDTVTDTDKIFFRFDCVTNDELHNKNAPYKLFASRLLPCYNKAEVDALLVNKADKPNKVIFNDIAPLTLADNTIYDAGENGISQLFIYYPEGDFICSLTFTLANIDGVDVTVVLPESKYIGGVPTFGKGETWELNIKNGVVVGGLIE